MERAQRRQVSLTSAARTGVREEQERESSERGRAFACGHVRSTGSACCYHFRERRRRRTGRDWYLARRGGGGRAGGQGEWPAKRAPPPRACHKPVPGRAGGFETIDASSGGAHCTPHTLARNAPATPLRVARPSCAGRAAARLGPNWLAIGRDGDDGGDVN